MDISSPQSADSELCYSRSLLFAESVSYRVVYSRSLLGYLSSGDIHSAVWRASCAFCQVIDADEYLTPQLGGPPGTAIL